MTEVKMQSPWVVYAKAVEALFEYDQDVDVTLDNENYKLTVRVYDDDKAESIARVLPEHKTFSNVTLQIEVIPDNDGEPTVIDHVRRAFAGNPVLVDVVECSVVPMGPTMVYALFAPEIVQIECDNAASPYGLVTTTYEDLAQDVLSVDGIMISSDAQ